MSAPGTTRHMLAGGLVLALVLGTCAGASAQAAAWGVDHPVTAFDPGAPPPPPGPTHHVVRERPVIAGVVMLGVGYLGSVVWGTYYLGSLHLGPVDCNDLYGGFHFLPVIGPVIGMFAGGGCIHDGLHAEEAIVPVASSLVQIVGLILTIVGMAGTDVPGEAPAVSFSADANGAYAALRWST